MKTRCSSSCVSPYSSEPSTPSRSACSTYDARTLANNSDLSMLNASNNLGDSPLGLLPAHNVRGRKNSSCQSPGTSEIEHLTKYNQNDCSTKNVIDKDGLQGSTQNYSNADFASATTSSDSNDFLIESPQPSTGTNTPDFISNVSSPSKPDDNNCSMKDNPIDNLQNTTDFAASVSSVCGMLVTSYRSNQSSPVLIARKKISNNISDNSNHIDEDHLREIKNITSQSAGVQRECHSALGLERFYPQLSKIDFQRINNEKGNVRTIVEFHEAIYISPRRHLDSQIKSKRIVINDFSPVERDRTSLLSTERRVRTQEVILGHRSEDTTPRETILPGLRNRKRIAGYETQKLDTRGSVLNRNLSSPLYFNKSSPLSAHQSSSSGSTSSGTKFALRGSISSSPEATSTSPSPSSSSSNYSPTLGVSESGSICSTPSSASSVLSSSSFCTLRARTGRFYDDSISASPLELNGKDRKCTTSAYGQFLATLSDLSVPSEGNLLEDHQRGDKDNIGITGPRIQTAEERHYQWKLRSIMVEKSLAKLRSAVCSSPDSQKTSNTDSQMNLTVTNSTRQNVKGKNGEIIAATIRKLLNGKEGYGPVKIRSDLTCDLTNDVSVDAESMFCPSPYEIYLRSKESSLARLPAYKRESNKESYSQSAALALSIENNRYHPSDPTSSTRPLPSSSSAINNSSSNNNRKLSFQSPSIVEKKIVDETHDGSEKNSTDCESSSGRSSPDTISIPSPSLSESPCDSPTFKSYPQSLHKAVTELSYPVQKSSDSVQKSSDSASFVSAVFVLSTLVILLLNLPYSWQWQWRYPNFYPWRDTQSLHHSPWVGELNASAVINQR